MYFEIVENGKMNDHPSPTPVITGGVTIGLLEQYTFQHIKGT